MLVGRFFPDLKARPCFASVTACVPDYSALSSRGGAREARWSAGGDTCVYISSSGKTH